jgi:arylsulfatase
LDGGGNHFNSKGFRERGTQYQEGTEQVEYPEGRYSTDLYTEKLIGFIDSTKNDDRPFFAFAAYTSPHWPLQVPDDYLDLYSGRYDDGYDVLRVERFASLKEAGIIPIDSELPPRNDAVTPWDDLSADEQKRESRKMELYAAMVDNLDDHVGRLLDHLKANGEFENTIVIFMSDNGAAGEDFYHSGGFVEYVQREYDNSYDKMGTAESFVSYGRPWAEAGSAPFHLFKGYTREGGMTAPMIIAGAGVSASDNINTAYATVMDLAPTFLELAGTTYPDDGSVEPILGESMVSFLSGESEEVHDDQYVTTLFHENLAFLRQGDWKLSTLDGIFEESKFELFDLSVDPGETYNLATDEPEKYAELIALWRVERRRLGIILPNDL